MAPRTIHKRAKYDSAVQLLTKRLETLVLVESESVPDQVLVQPAAEKGAGNILHIDLEVRQARQRRQGLEHRRPQHRHHGAKRILDPVSALFPVPQPRVALRLLVQSAHAVAVGLAVADIDLDGGDVLIAREELVLFFNILCGACPDVGDTMASPFTLLCPQPH